MLSSPPSPLPPSQLFIDIQFKIHFVNVKMQTYKGGLFADCYFHFSNKSLITTWKIGINEPGREVIDDLKRIIVDLLIKRGADGASLKMPR